AVLTDVADKTGLAVDARLVAHDVAQELTGGADKGPAVILLILAWGLANDGDPVIDAINDDRMLVGNEPAEVGDHFLALGNLKIFLGGGISWRSQERLKSGYWQRAVHKLPSSHNAQSTGQLSESPGITAIWIAFLIGKGGSLASPRFWWG